MVAQWISIVIGLLTVKQWKVTDLRMDTTDRTPSLGATESASRSPRLSEVDDLLRQELVKRTQADDRLWSSPYRDMRESVHAFFQYPAMMIPAVQKTVIEVVTTVQPDITTMLDPFVGAGTTLTAAMHKGLNCYGQDVNPLAVLLSRTKTGPFFHEALSWRTREAVQRANGDTSEQVEADFPNLSKWFRRDVIIELSRLRRAIQSERQIWARRFMWVALAETIRITSNDRTSTYKLHVRPDHEILERNLSAIEIFSDLITQNLDDLLRFKNELESAGYVKSGRFTRRVRVALSDTAEEIVRFNGPTKQVYDLLVTSAPYGDNTSTIPYGQHSYLPLQWIDFKDISSEADESFLRTTQEVDRRSLGGSRSRRLDEQIEQLRPLSRTLASTFDALASKPRDRSSRVAAFYSDFQNAVDCIVGAMQVNAYLIWTVGNRRIGGIEIKNDLILTELLERRNILLVDHVDRTIHQKRMPPRNRISKTMSREKILIFRKTVSAGDVQ